MSLAYIRQAYKVPAQEGGRILYTGDPAGPRAGTIMGAEGGHLSVELEGDLFPVPLHPTWEVEYLPSGQTNGGSP